MPITKSCKHLYVMQSDKKCKLFVLSNIFKIFLVSLKTDVQFSLRKKNSCGHLNLPCCSCPNLNNLTPTYYYLMCNSRNLLIGLANLVSFIV